MTILIAILISIVISLGISFYFRKLQQNEDGITKVRKYADRRQEDLLKLFKELQGQYNLMSTDFKSEQTRANAAIKLLKQQNDEFAEKIKLFEQNIQAVQSIKNQIDSYAQVLNDLNEMTDNVEENLERLHNSSQLITQVSNRIAKQEQSVSQLEKQIPGLSKEFAEKNAEQLKTIGTKLLSEYENYAQKISQEIQDSKKAAENALISIQQKFQSAYDQASERADKLENTAFEHLSEQAQKRSDKFLFELKTQTESLENELSTRFMTASESITNKFEQITGMLEDKSLEIHDSFEKKSSDTIQT